MPTVELVMCPSCGHPQEISAQCVACGAALPAPVSATQPQNRPLQEAPVSVTLAGRTLTLQGDRLSLEGVPDARVLALSELRGVQLISRRAWEGLGGAALFAVALALGHSPLLRMTFGLLLVLSLILTVSYRRYRCRILTVNARLPILSLGTLARRGAADDRRLQQGFEQLGAGLAARGVEVLS
ncbi:MAG: hypothetical protein M3Y59_17725 [Myxococcota bacterium]|nr:hypothetical protein [Myxococcota bacterium]